MTTIVCWINALIWDLLHKNANECMKEIRRIIVKIMTVTSFPVLYFCFRIILTFLNCHRNYKGSSPKCLSHIYYLTIGALEAMYFQLLYNYIHCMIEIKLRNMFLLWIQKVLSLPRCSHFWQLKFFMSITVFHFQSKMLNINSNVFLIFYYIHGLVEMEARNRGKE